MECGGAMTDKASLSPTSNAPPSPYSDCTAAAFYGSPQSPSSSSVSVGAGLGLLGVAGLGCSAVDAFAAAAAGDIPNDPGKMFIGGLSWQTTPESIREYFSLFGELAEVMVMKDPATRRSRGFGFITFGDPAAVEKVLSFPVHQLDGKIIEPKVAVPRKTNPKLVMRTKKIFVGGLSATTSLDDVRMYFEQFAKVKDAMLAYDKVTNRHRGFGFVTFDNDEVVDKICEIHFHEINGKMVESKKALPKEPRGLTGGYGGPTGYGGPSGAGGPAYSGGGGRQQHLMGLALGRSAFGGFGLTGGDAGFPSPNAAYSAMRGPTSDTHRNFDNAYYGARIQQQQQQQQQHHLNGDLQQQQRGYYSKYSQYMNDRNNSNTSYMLNGNDASHFNCSSSGGEAENNLDDFPPLSNINYNRNAGLISL